MSLKRIFTFAVILAIGTASALPSVTSDGVKVTLDADDSTSMGSNMKLMFRIYQECSARDGGLVPCLKMRAITFFDRVAKLEIIPLADSVNLIRTPAAASEDRTSRALSESEIEATLPRDLEQRDAQLSTLLMERVARFFRSHTVQVDLPEINETELARSFDEGRGKMKKMMGMMMMMGGAMKFGLLMLLKIKGLFFLAKKALIISKIALILALVGVIRKMMSGGGGESSSHGWSSGGGGGGGSSYGGGSSGWNKRSMDLAHDIAYKAQRPAVVTATAA